MDVIAKRERLIEGDKLVLFCVVGGGIGQRGIDRDICGNIGVPTHKPRISTGEFLRKKQLFSLC